MGVLEFLGLCKLCIKYAWGIPKAVWEFLIDLRVKHPFVNVSEFQFCSFSCCSRRRLFMYSWRLQISLWCLLVENLLGQ